MASFIATALVILGSHAPLVAVAHGQLTLCQGAPEKWAALPATGAAPVAIKTSTGMCISVLKDSARKCDARGAGCLGLGDCATAPKFSIVKAGATENLKTTVNGKEYCVDAQEVQPAVLVQLYACVGSSNQGWSVQDGQIKETFNAKKGQGAIGLSNATTCKPWEPPAPAPRPPPPPPSAFCPKYHPIHAGNVYDPSGPLIAEDGIFHTWEDAGAWSHWWSKDLIHWDGNFSTSTKFGGDTGSVSPTPSGVYAFWPIMGGPGRGSIASAKSLDPKGGSPGLEQWQQRGATIPMPKRINAGFRDPVRAFEYPEKSDQWWVGVGGGNKPGCETSELAPSCGAQFCLFKAKDNTLAEVEDAGALYTTNVTFGLVDKNIVWQPQNTSANMMECPDLFPLGPDGKWVLIGSLYKTNQWWVGTLSGNPPRFTPENVGIVDYGNGYAAKTGSTWVQTGASRRLVFGFTGWQEPTAPSGCGRYLIMPRDLSIAAGGNSLVVEPIPEASVLRVQSSETRASHTAGESALTALAAGSQVEVRINCTAASWPTTGKVELRTLASADGKFYTAIGYDFASQSNGFYADHSHCCSAPNAIVQKALTPALGKSLDLTVFVDSGLIEAFALGRVITPLLNPDVAAGGLPAARVSSFVNTATGVKCTVGSFELKY